ncbi:MAG: ABC transporter substrate-binding protein [Thermoflexales bacterium]|nr:ABC transporter substrate-binding protein [Thermoflexales bacterium]
MNQRITRRQLLQLASFAGLGALAAACGSSAPAEPRPQTTPQAPTESVEQPLTPAERPRAPVNLKEVPRNRTLIVNYGGAGGQFTNQGITNPWGLGFNHQEGNSLLWEPLFYYSVFADKEIPWLAESGTYNADYTELTIKMRPGAEWSDGVPVTSADVKYTLDTLITNDALNYHAQVAELVKEVQAPDERTVIIKFNKPSPRFKFEILSLKFDTGIPVLPKHVMEQMYDVVAMPGDDDMVHSGMFNTVQTSQQKVFDLREDWWGFKTGFQKKPDVERVLVIPISDMTTAAQRVVNNEVDATVDMRPSLIRSVVEQNPKVTTHTGRQEPFGYVDWWPNSFWVNTQLEPYSNPDVRWAINLAIDRDTLNRFAFNGVELTTPYPFPEYPALKPYLERVRGRAEALGVTRFSLEESAARMQRAGFTKDGEGFWVKDGKRVNATIHGFEVIHADIAPILEQMLRKAGFEAAINFGTDAFQNMVDGRPGLYLYGHGGSLIDPYATLELYHTRSSKPTQAGVGGSNRFSRYSNPKFDQIVDEMSVVPPGDPKLNALFEQAMDIYWTEMIDIPLIQWLHRIPYNTTYWTNWPTQENRYLNGAFWHHTFPLLVLNLKAAG